MALNPTSSRSEGGGSSPLYSATPITADVTVSSSDAANPTTIISLGAQAYSAGAYVFKFYCGVVYGATAAAHGCVVLFNDGTTELNRVADIRLGSDESTDLTLEFPWTVTAGSHTFLLAGFKTGGAGGVNGVFGAGAAEAGNAAYPPITFSVWTAD